MEIALTLLAALCVILIVVLGINTSQIKTKDDRIKYYKALVESYEKKDKLSTELISLKNQLIAHYEKGEFLFNKRIQYLEELVELYLGSNRETLSRIWLKLNEGKGKSSKKPVTSKGCGEGKVQRDETKGKSSDRSNGKSNDKRAPSTTSVATSTPPSAKPSNSNK